MNHPDAQKLSETVHIDRAGQRAAAPSASSTAGALLRVLRVLAVPAGFLALSILMTWPLVTRMSDSLVGQVGDNIYFVWMIGWLKKALFELGANPLDVWFLNYPEGWSLAYTEITPAMILLALPFSLLGGPTFGYNAAMLLSFALSGWFMALWVRRLTGRQDAALLAGVLFAFVPYRFAHYLIGHLNLSGTMWFPLFFMGLTGLLIGDGRPWKMGLLAGVSLGLIALTSQYYLFMALLVGSVMAAAGFFLHRCPWKGRPFWQGVGAAALSGLPLVLAGVAPYLLLLGQGGLPDRNLGIVRPYSAGLTDYLLPSTDHFLWGRWIGEHFNRDMWVEGTLYVGALALALALVAWFNRRRAGWGVLLALLGWGSLFALVLSLGTDLHWNGAPLEITTPGFLSRWVSRETLPIPLPGYLMFQYFPFFAKLRAFMRFGVFVLVFIAAAAGIGASWLLGRAGRRAGWLAAGLLVLALLDFYPGPYQQFVTVRPRPVDTWLSAQPGQGAVIQFPFSQEEDQDQIYYTLEHGKPFVGGFFNAFPPAQYARIKPLMEHFPDEQSVALLDELGVQWVLVDSTTYSDMPALRTQAEELGLQYHSTQGDQWVFEVPR